MGYVVAFNRDRDFYQVPLALSECGLFSGLVTDLYYPDSLWLRRLPGMQKIAHRHAEGLRAVDVRWNVPAIALQVLTARLGADPAKTFQRVEKALSKGALQLARKRNAHLFLYSGCALEAFSAHEAKGLTKGLFMFHPHSLLNREILQRDFERFPECAWSYANEADTASPLPLTKRLDGEWSRADFIVAASEFTKNSLVHAGCAAERIHVAPYGMDPAKVALPAGAKSQDRCRFLFAGQGVQRKGLHHLLRAWRTVTATDAELIVIASSLDPGIGALAGDRVRILPRQESDSLRRHFAEAHVFVMPSLIEGFGLVYGEALASGTFVIGTANTGLPDLCPPDWAARVIPAGSIELLSDALHRALADWRAGRLDPSAIQTFAASMPWEGFRHRVADIARRYHP